MECAEGDSDGVPPDIVRFLTVSLMLVYATHMCNAYYVALARSQGPVMSRREKAPLGLEPLTLKQKEDKKLVNNEQDRSR